MNIVAAILIFGASGSAARTVESPQSIVGTVVRMTTGLVARKAGEGLADGITNWGSVRERLVRGNGSTSLSIDCQRSGGLADWIRGISRVCEYVADTATSGSVCWSGGRNVRGRWVRWSVTVSDNRLVVTGDTWNVARLDHVRLVIRADEYAGGSRIAGAATGWTTLGQHCGLVRRIVEREIRKGLAGPLARIEVSGRELYAGGDPAVLIEAFVSRLGGR